MATGVDWGEIKVDKRFIRLLAKILGPDFVNYYKSECPQEWKQLMDMFEKSRRLTKPDGKYSMRLLLPYSAALTYEQVTGKSIHQVVAESGHHGVRMFNGLLIFEQRVVADMFKPMQDKIVSHIESIIQNPKLQPCKYLFMVGDECNEFLQLALEDNFERQEVLIPEEPMCAVIKGAVLFGHFIGTGQI